MSRIFHIVFDTIMVLFLLLVSAYAVFITLLVDFPFQWAPALGMLCNAFAVGTVLYLLQAYHKTGHALSIVLLILGWLFGLMVVVFGFAPGEFSDPTILAPKALIFFYPLLYIYALIYNEDLGALLFKGATLLFITTLFFLLALLGPVTQIATSLSGGELNVTAVHAAIAATVLALSAYLIYRLVPHR